MYTFHNWWPLFLLHFLQNTWALCYTTYSLLVSLFLCCIHFFSHLPSRLSCICTYATLLHYFSNNVINNDNSWYKNDIFPCVYSLSLSQYIIVSSLLKVPQLTLFEYKYPDWSITVGYIIGLSSFIWIPVYMVYKLVWTPGSLKQVSGWCEGDKKGLH